MEDQKKPDGNQNKPHKRKNHRRHGYFIQPPADKKSAPATEGQPQRNASPEQNTSDKPRHSDKTKVNEASNTTPQPTEVKDQKHNGAEHKKNRHSGRNRSRNHQRPAQQSPEKAVATDQAKSAEVAPREKSVQQQHNHQNAKKKNHTDKQEQISPMPEIKLQRPVHTSDEYEEYKLTVDESDAKRNEASPVEQEKTEVVGIRFKSTGKIYYFDPNGASYSKGSSAIVDTARGLEFGEVAMCNSMVNSADIVPPLRQVIRGATPSDVAHHKENKAKEEDAFRICNEKIAEHKLDMKLIEAQYTFDNTKLLFYFTSSDRVDFRNLVKDLASVFRTRIELRQIGIRDEAKLMGGLGMCGRPLCCTLFLSDFDQVSIKMAKEQNLSLNSAKISGICGRLMCCLKYEHEAYEYEIKRTPPVDSLVRTENGDGVVTEIRPLQGQIKVRLLASPEIPPKTYHRDEVTMLRKKQNAENKENKENK